MTVSGSFFNKINAVPTEDLDQYYLSFHEKNGFDLERKRYSVGFLSKVVTAIFRVWRICTGHSYNFDYSVRRFAECLKKDGITRHDLKVCSKAQKRLVALIKTVLAKKHKNPDELIQLVTRAKFQLFEKLAQAQPASSIEFFSKIGLFSEAKAHILAGEDLSVVSQKCKNDLLGYFLKKMNHDLAEALLKAGADPASQSRKFLQSIDAFLRKPESALHKYFIVRSLSRGLFFIKEIKPSYHLNSDLTDNLTDSWHLYLETPQVFVHTVTKLITYLDSCWQQIQPGNYTPYLRLLHRLEAVSAKVTKISKLASQLIECRHRLVLQGAAVARMSPLDFAIKHDFSNEAVEMVERGADLTALAISDKNLLLSLALQGEHFSAAEKVLAAGADPNWAKNELAPLIKYYKSTHNSQAIQSLLNRGANIADKLFIVNPMHYQNKVVLVVPDKMAPGCTLDDLVVLFSKINFTNPNGKFYANPSKYANFYPGVPLDQKVNYLKEGLLTFISNIRNCTPFIGTPKAGPTLDLFYNIMERAVTHTIRKIKDMRESDEKQLLIRGVITEYIRAALLCGGKQYATACQQFVAVTKGRASTFAEEILDILAAYREVLFQSIVPEGQQSVHDFNKMMYLLGRELGIPGAEMMGEFDDEYRGEGFDSDLKRIEFSELYTPNNILFESVKQAVEQTAELRDKYFDWIKANIPDYWQKEQFDGIRREVEKKASLAEKKNYLKEQDIYPLTRQTLDDAIEDERKARYLAGEVVEDMNAMPMKIKPAAIAYMLERIGVLSSMGYD